MGCLWSKTSGDNITLAADIEEPSSSLRILHEEAEFLFETNQEGIQSILDCKKGVWKNKDLFDLVPEYFESNLLTFEFCTTLEKCVKRARDSQLMLQVALQQFEQEQEQIREEGTDGEREFYAITVQELTNFKAAGNPFDVELLSIMRSVHDLLMKLQVNQKEQDRKLRLIKAWRTVLSVLFGAAFAAALICTVVGAAIAAPPVVTASAAAAAVTLGSMGTLFCLLWKKYQNEMRGERGVVTSMNIVTFVATRDIDNISVLVNKLGYEMEDLLRVAGFAIRGEAAATVLAVVVDEIRKKLSVFMQVIDDLEVHALMFSRHIWRSRFTILQKIKNPSSG